jgi:hypothetical protein
MKPAIMILSILVISTGAVAYKNQQQAEEAINSAVRLNQQLVAVRERLETLEQKPEPTSPISWADPAASNGEVAPIPEEVVAAIASQIAQNSNALGAIARGIPTAPTSTANSNKLDNPAELDQQVRDTLAAVRDEEREERNLRNQERMIERAQERASRMAEELGLNGQQAEQFTSLLAEHSTEMGQIWSESRELDLDRGEMRSFFEQTREEQNGEIQEILNADQYAQYLELPQGGATWGRRGGGSNNGGGGTGGGNSNGGGGRGGF